MSTLVEEPELDPPKAEFPELSSEDIVGEAFENLYVDEVANQSVIESMVEAPILSPSQILSKFAYLVDICGLQLISIPSKSSSVSAWSCKASLI